MKKENINKIFESIANKYDLMNDIMSFRLHRKWKEKLVNLINIDGKKEYTILDLGAGTGDISNQINKKNKNKSNYSIVLADPNIEMIKNGRIKLKENNLKWLASYGEKLPFKNSKFDFVTMSFSLRNVYNINLTLSEINRVLKKNGQFICLEFGKIKSLTLNSIYSIYSENVIPKLGQKITGNITAYNYLVESIKKFPSQDKICKILKSKKFTNIKFYNLNFGVAVIYICKKK
ncbi:MAG: Ubiquinone/menaquinone biosynthesis C-methyltransferase UbiE [Alphaproteobacteria bacterium MarineAlpha6_Bin4]|nr:MAG: Ubiquinone/menaquinone biosynthesis C-methyltransferase UbiE [Alphaproteobacteria bacterium MarineAlpha6_Bin4]